MLSDRLHGVSSAFEYWRTWRKIQWSDESRFLLHVINGRMRVWRQNIRRIPQGASSQLIWGISLMIASWTWSPYEET